MTDWTTYGDPDETAAAPLAGYFEQQGAMVCSSEGATPLLSQDEHDAIATDAEALDQCPHLPADRLRDPESGDQVCTACGEVVVLVDSQVVTVPASGTVETFDVGQGVLEHLPWPPGPNVRPYVPEDVEHEMVAMVARLNSGARYEARITRELGEAEHAYDLAYAVALLESEKRSKELREADARVRCREQWDRLAQLRTDYKVTRAGMHTLRAQLNAMQSVGASVRVASGSGR